MPGYILITKILDFDFELLKIIKCRLTKIAAILLHHTVYESMRSVLFDSRNQLNRYQTF